jgi:electron transfer flavoprotein alpha subunit
LTVLVFAELDGDTIADASLRAITLARDLVPPGSPVAIAVFGPPAAAFAPVALAATFGVSDIYDISVDAYAPQAWARVLAGLATEIGAGAVLAAGTDHGNEVLAHVGAITGLPMAANVVSAGPAGASGAPAGDGSAPADAPAPALCLTRQRWAGLLLEDAVLEAPVALLTVAADAVPANPAATTATPVIHNVKPDVPDGDLVVRAERSAAGAGGASLATARVVVGGGRGVGGADGFAPLEELAGLLGGVVGVSRVVTSEGWRPHTMQVGQTGTKITPELYLACGISGAIQHIAGCSGAKHIIAINTDPGAPMLTHADYAVIGDLHKVIPVLIDALKSRGGLPVNFPELGRVAEQGVPLARESLTRER